MHPITDQKLKELSNSEVIARMDEFINQTYSERYSLLPPGFPKNINVVSELMNTAAITYKSSEDQRRIAYACFTYLIQCELTNTALGIQNGVLYGHGFSNDKWQSPSFRLNHAALTQYQVISSRICFEAFIELLYLIDKDKRIKTDSSNSKLKAFKKWLLEEDNPFNYFAHTLVTAYNFDRTQRSDEVHGTSRHPRRLLRLEDPTSEEQDKPLELTNALQNSWDPLLQILDGTRPNQMHISIDDHGWFEAFISKDQTQIEQELEKMFKDLK